MSTIAELLTKLTIDDSDFRRGIDSAAKVVSDFAHSAVTAMEYAAGIIVASLGGAFYGLVHILNDVDDKVESLVKASTSLGVGVEPLQSLQYAAEQTGVSTESLTTSLGRLLKNTQLAVDGNQTLINAFGALGLSATDLKNKSIDEEYIAISEGLAKIKSPAQQALIAVQLFGKGGIEQLGLLKEDVQGLVDDFKSLGTEIDGDQATSIHTFGDSVKRLGTIWEGFKMQLAAALAGPLFEFINWVTESIKSMGGLKEVAGSVASFIINSFQGVVNTFKNVLDIITKIRIAAAEVKLKADTSALQSVTQNDVANAATGGGNKISQPTLALQAAVTEDRRFLDELKATLGQSPLQTELTKLSNRINSAQQTSGEMSINGKPIDLTTSSEMTVNGQKIDLSSSSGDMTVNGQKVDLNAPDFTINGKPVDVSGSSAMSINNQPVKLDVNINAGSGLVADVVNSSQNRDVILNIINSAISAATRGDQR